MSRTISSSTTGPVVLGTADTPLYITSTGTVTSTGSADGIDGGAGTTWTITNAGVVSAISGNGVSLASSGTIGNTGSISGNDALVLRAGGSVTNNAGGSISGLGALGAGLGTGCGRLHHGRCGYGDEPGHDLRRGLWRRPGGRRPGDQHQLDYRW